MSQIPSSSLQTGPVGTSAAPTNERVGFVCSHNVPGAGGVRRATGSLSLAAQQEEAELE